MTVEGLQNFDLTDEEHAMIISTRIRVGRNLADFPLGPGVTKEQRLEIMAKVVGAADTFEDDLKGTFYKLDGMDKTTQQQLIDDHFLFK
jgi:protein-arginine kinase